jgi:cytochrome b subunit of formate dehydrogenase
VSQRIEHAVLLVAFTTLAVTGLVQKFATAPVSEDVIRLLGGIEAARRIHRLAAIGLMAESIYHIVGVLYRIVVRGSRLTMLPVIEDFRHLLQDVLFNLGKRRRRAYVGRYGYAEKVEYLAVVWGTVIMAITGFMMWNPIATARLLPGEFIPAAKAAHGAEAILAVLAILLWHFYHVHIRHLNRSMFTGRLTREEMQHEHPAELAAIEAGQAGRLPPPAVMRRRRRVFLPASAVFSAALLFAVIRFVTFEETAITTIPPAETAPIFLPQTPTPLPSPAPSMLTRWSGDIDDLLAERCGACHGPAAMGGLDLSSYDGALRGGRSGPAIVPGDPEASVLVQTQGSGAHPGQLTETELAGMIAWIQAGAPER